MAKRTLTKEDVLAMLRKRQGDRSLRDFARELEVSAAYLSDVYRGNRSPGPSILLPLGIKVNVKTTVEYEYQVDKKSA